jgi:hypothetical protein
VGLIGVDVPAGGLQGRYVREGYNIRIYDLSTPTSSSTIMEEKKPFPSWRLDSQWSRSFFRTAVVGSAICVVGLFHLRKGITIGSFNHDDTRRPSGNPYGHFPKPKDPFRFLPCTNTSIVPALDDIHPGKTWAKVFDPNPEHWSWGNKTINEDVLETHSNCRRSIYLCGYLDVPLDYTNASDPRIVRLAVTKLQVSGLAQVDSPHSLAGNKSERTLVIEYEGQVTAHKPLSSI